MVLCSTNWRFVGWSLWTSLSQKSSKCIFSRFKSTLTVQQIRPAAKSKKVNLLGSRGISEEGIFEAHFRMSCLVGGLQFQPIWKMFSQNGFIFPKFSGWTFQKYLSCHHPGFWRLKISVFVSHPFLHRSPPPTKRLLSPSRPSEFIREKVPPLQWYILTIHHLPSWYVGRLRDQFGPGHGVRLEITRLLNRTARWEAPEQIERPQNRKWKVNRTFQRNPFSGADYILCWVVFFCFGTGWGSILGELWKISSC